MDLLVLGLVLSISFSAAQGVTPRCCVEITKRFPFEILTKVTKYDVQTSNGVCAIDALILYVDNKRYCANPKLERIVKHFVKTRMRRMSVRHTSSI